MDEFDVGKSELLKKFHKSLKKAELKKINELISQSITTTSNEMLLALGNPDGPTGIMPKSPTWQGIKPDLLVIDSMKFAQVAGIPDSWEPVGYVGDDAIQWDTNPFEDLKVMYLKMLEEQDKKMAPIIKKAEPHWTVSQKVYFGIIDVNGKEVKVPVVGIPEFVSNFTVATDFPDVEINHAGIEIANIYVEYNNGSGVNVVKGPFTLKDSYQKIEPAPAPPKTQPIAYSVTIDHNGQLHFLKAGDTFTLTYDVKLAGQKAFAHNETIKVLEFQTTKVPGSAPALKPSPFLLNKGHESAARESIAVKNHQDYGTWTFDWIEKLECFIIGGHFGNKRYEVVLGQPIPPGQILSSLGFGKGELPTGLNNIIQSCSQALAKQITDKRKVFNHPKLHEIQVKCPGLGKDVASDWGAPHTVICDKSEDSLYNMIQHVNDTHRWTREAIAEWIDTLDEQPVFYPVIESQRVANSAKVVTFEPPVQKGTKD